MPRTTYTLEQKFFKKTFANMMWRVKNEKEKVGIIEFKTPKQLEEHWNNQKEKYGMKCPYTGVEMIMPEVGKRLKENEKNRKRVYVTNHMAVDQIWPGKGYTPMNTVFCSYKFNRDKGSITPDGCQAVIDLYNLRTKIFLNHGYNNKKEEKSIKYEIDIIEKFIQEVSTNSTFEGKLISNPKDWFEKLKLELERRKEKIKNLPILNYYN